MAARFHRASSLKAATRDGLAHRRHARCLLGGCQAVGHAHGVRHRPGHAAGQPKGQRQRDADDHLRHGDAGLRLLVECIAIFSIESESAAIFSSSSLKAVCGVEVLLHQGFGLAQRRAAVFGQRQGFEPGQGLVESLDVVGQTLGGTAAVSGVPSTLLRSDSLGQCQSGRHQSRQARQGPVQSMTRLARRAHLTPAELNCARAEGGKSLSAASRGCAQPPGSSPSSSLGL